MFLLSHEAPDGADGVMMLSCDADKLMRGHEVVEELLDVVGKAIPVAVSAVNELGEGFGSCLL